MKHHTSFYMNVIFFNDLTKWEMSWTHGCIEMVGICCGPSFVCWFNRLPAIVITYEALPSLDLQLYNIFAPPPVTDFTTTNMPDITVSRLLNGFQTNSHIVKWILPEEVQLDGVPESLANVTDPGIVEKNRICKVAKYAIRAASSVSLLAGLAWFVANIFMFINRHGE